MTVSSSAQPVQLMCIHQCNSDELQLFNNDKSLRSGQEAILYCEAFGGNPRATLHWLKVGFCIYLSSTTPLSISLYIHPTTATSSMFYNTIRDAFIYVLAEFVR